MWCGEGYVRTEDPQHADLFTKTLDIQKFRKHAKRDLNLVRYHSNAAVQCERCELFYCRKGQFL